jgi:hypothetical protein
MKCSMHACCSTVFAADSLTGKYLCSARKLTLQYFS